MASVEANVTALELEKVLPKVQTVFDRDDKFYSSIDKRDVEKISSRQMRVPLEIRPGGSFQLFNPDGGDLGRGSAPQFDKATLTSVFASENIEYTKLVQWSTDDDRKAIANAVRRYTATALDEMRRQLDAQAMGDGSGTLATITSVATTAGQDTYTCTTDGFGTRLVRVGQTIQVFDSTKVTNRGSGTITVVDVENKTFTINTSISGATGGDFIILNGVSAPTSLPSFFGVPYHHSNASTGTWLGFSRAATPEIRANRVNANSAALALQMPRLAINKIGNRIGIDEHFNPVAWCHPCQMAALENIGQLVSIIHKQPKEEALDLYFNDNMQLAGAAMRKSYNWDKTRVDFVVKELWGRGEILPIGFYTTDGRKTFEIRGASGGVAAADIFYMVVGFQFFVSNPAGTSYIDTLAVPSGY